MEQRERKPAPARKPPARLLSNLTPIDIVVTAVAVPAAILLFNKFYPDSSNTTARLLIEAAVGLVILLNVLAVIAWARRMFAYRELLDEVCRQNPPARHISDTPWLDDLQRFVDTFDVLSPADRERLRTRFDDVWSGDHDNLWWAVDRRADLHSRLTPAVKAELARLGVIPCGAAPAALAVLVRDLITVEAFHQLTEAWVAAKLPLPGGDVPAVWHMRWEACRVQADPSGWELISAENVPAFSGESADQILAGLAQNLPPADIDARTYRLRLRIWRGERPVQGDPGEPPTAEVYSPYMTPKTAAAAAR